MKLYQIINEIIEIKKINGEPNYLIVKPDTYAYNFIINVDKYELNIHQQNHVDVDKRS